jgi:hypothetical protein
VIVPGYPQNSSNKNARPWVSAGSNKSTNAPSRRLLATFLPIQTSLPLLMIPFHPYSATTQPCPLLIVQRRNG